MGGIPAAGVLCPFCHNVVPASKFKKSWFLSPRCFHLHNVDGSPLMPSESQEKKCTGSQRPVPTTSPWWAGLGRKKRQ